MRLVELYKKYDYEIFVGGCILVLFVLFISRLGRSGTYSRTVYLPRGLWTRPTKARETREPKVSSGEAECRKTLQELFRKPFPNERPDFLRNTVTGGLYNLELDCYNESLKLAVEYSGIQHYKYVPYFHKNKEAFLNQKYRDEMKRRLCKDADVVLIEVPYTVKTPDIRAFLIGKLRENGYIK